MIDERIACKWCKAQSDASAKSCERCGAPLDSRNLVTDSGWRQAPRLHDLTEVTIGSTVIQIDGTIVPAADVSIGGGESVFFEHHAMLWKDEGVAMSVMDAPGGMKRMLANQPFVLSVAQGPGRVAVSRDAPGEMVVLPIEVGTEFDLREHAMLLATASLSYSFEKLPGLKATMVTGSGMYMDRYVAAETAGLILIHGYGNVLDRTLGDGETIEVEPGGFLYKESTVTMTVSTHKLQVEGASAAGQAAKSFAKKGLAGLKAARELKKQGIGGLMSGDVLQTASGIFTGSGITLMKLTGPGRVGVQSMYQDFGSA